MSDRKARIAKLAALPMLAMCGFLAAATFAGIGLGTPLTESTTTDPSTTDSTVTETTTPPGGEGCTPGYWKQSHHFDSYPAGYAPGQLFDTYFENAFPGMTLLQVLQQGGGGLKALGRHTVAALLNSASTGVEYDLTTSEVVSMFDAAFPGGDYEGLKNVFAESNEDGCPLN